VLAATELGSAPTARVVISIPIGGPMSPFAVEYTLRPVFVSSLQQSGSGDGSTESVS
jgi:hypothetical protein